MTERKDPGFFARQPSRENDRAAGQGSGIVGCARDWWRGRIAVGARDAVDPHHDPLPSGEGKESGILSPRRLQNDIVRSGEAES